MEACGNLKNLPTDDVTCMSFIASAGLGVKINDVKEHFDNVSTGTKYFIISTRVRESLNDVLRVFSNSLFHGGVRLINP